MSNSTRILFCSSDLLPPAPPSTLIPTACSKALLCKESKYSTCAYFFQSFHQLSKMPKPPYKLSLLVEIDITGTDIDSSIKNVLVLICPGSNSPAKSNTRALITCVSSIVIGDVYNGSAKVGISPLSV